jgi:hypothetical protein
MRNAGCVGSCVFASLGQLISEHYSILVAAGVFGALFGLVFGGGTWGLIGAGAGMILAIVYGYVPRMADCVGTCPLR